MKTVEEINGEMKSIVVRLQDIRLVTSKMTQKREREHYNWLSEVKRYLETDPREDFLKESLSRHEDTIQQLEERYKEQFPNVRQAKHKTAWMAIHNVPKMKEHIKVLQYILS